jgi:hypothetical protein
VCFELFSLCRISNGTNTKCGRHLEMNINWSSVNDAILFLPNLCNISWQFQDFGEFLMSLRWIWGLVNMTADYLKIDL